MPTELVYGIFYFGRKKEKGVEERDPKNDHKDQIRLLSLNCRAGLVDSVIMVVTVIILIDHLSIQN